MVSVGSNGRPEQNLHPHSDEYLPSSVARKAHRILTHRNVGFTESFSLSLFKPKGEIFDNGNR
eukprot:gene17199-23518_t